VEAGVARLLRLVEWSGIFQVQFVTNGRGRFLIDLNPRMYGSLALAVAAGPNLPALWAALLLGERVVPVTGYRIGVHYRSEERDAGALVDALLHHRWRAVAATTRPHARTVHAVGSWRDPLPLLRTAGRLAAGLHQTVVNGTPHG
jgi:predicted ATP-grasp superfamily ATP-dependent carboligase